MFAAPEVSAQQRPAPLFYDQRRLPDMEVERRNQEVLSEQRRVSEEQRLETELLARRKTEERLTEQRQAAEAEAKKKADEARQVAEAEAKRKADEQKRIAAEADAKKKADEARQVAEAEAKRKADEEKRIAAEADAKKKADEARQVAEAEAKRKADEEKRIAAEADAKKKADEARQVAEAEAKRKADEEKRIAAEADAKKKADEARQVAEAEAKRKADEEKRIAAEADAKKKAEEVRLAELEGRAKAAAAAAAQRTQANATPTAPPPAIAPLALAIGGPITNAINTTTVPAACEAPRIATNTLAGGGLEVTIDSACRSGQAVTLQYAGYDLIRKLDSNGRAAIAIDLFMGKAEAPKLTFADGRSEPLATPVNAFEGLSKVALIWNAPVDLDLHAIEGGGSFGKQGHVWAKAPSNMAKSQAVISDSGRGAGLLSMADDGQHEGTKVEVYTFVHSPEQDTGAVTMLVDYASRGAQPSGEMCGTGRLAEVAFEVVILDRKGQISRESGIVPGAKCGDTLASNTRYLRGAIPDLRFRK